MSWLYHLQGCFGTRPDLDLQDLSNFKRTFSWTLLKTLRWVTSSIAAGWGLIQGHHSTRKDFLCNHTKGNRLHVKGEVNTFPSNFSSHQQDEVIQIRPPSPLLPGLNSEGQREESILLIIWLCNEPVRNFSIILWDFFPELKFTHYALGVIKVIGRLLEARASDIFCYFSILPGVLLSPPPLLGITRIMPFVTRGLELFFVRRTRSCCQGLEHRSDKQWPWILFLA